MELLLTTAAFLCIYSNTYAAGPRIILDMTKPSVGQLRRFWDSTGLCPPAPRSSAAQFLLSQDERFNLALIGSLPDRSISQVRIHWLLDLIRVSSVTTNGVPVYNFTYLDQLLDWMQLFRLNPGFELMGNPSEFFRDFGNETQVEDWKQLVRQVAFRYAERYGLETVARWRFETWNEPDLKGYNIYNFTLQSYLRYFAACSAGLQEAGRGRLRLGGPAGLFKAPKKHPLCWGLLRHCANLTLCPLDFISFHKKGGGSSSAILEEDLQLARNISTMFPTLAGISLVNDEADPLTGWSKSEDWRADVRYGAMVASVIVSHNQDMVRQQGLPLELLSNDNAFLNYYPYFFTQRTLLARFQINNTNPPHVQFFKKPVYNTMTLLSFLGTHQMEPAIKNNDSRLSVLATKTDDGGAVSYTVLMVYNNDTHADLEDVLTVRIRVRNIVDPASRYVIYLLDNNHTNPEQEWIRAGSPNFPDQQQRARIRTMEGPHRARGPSHVPRSRKIALSLTLPSVAVLHICSRPAQLPGQVSRVMAYNVTHNEVMLYWSDTSVHTRCIKTYEVEFRPVGSSEYNRINNEYIVSLSFQYSLISNITSEEVMGWYRVRALDYWNRAGPFSLSVRYPSE